MDNFKTHFVNNLKQNIMEIKLNQIELASELAAAELFDNWQDSIKILDESDEDEIKYTDEAQQIFDELYDKYMNLIDNYKI